VDTHPDVMMITTKEGMDEDAVMAVEGTSK
jgi:hypothetical protein